MSKIRIDEILFDAIAEYKKWNPDHVVNIYLDDFPEDEEILTQLANYDALKVVFKNLIDNACKFSEDKTSAVSIQQVHNNLLISVYNNGSPIPDKDRQKIFEPFFRSDATAQGKSGHGVGLAIVKQIIELHQGKLELQTSEKGNTFIVKI